MGGVRNFDLTDSASIVRQMEKNINFRQLQIAMVICSMLLPNVMLAASVDPLIPLANLSKNDLLPKTWQANESFDCEPAFFDPAATKYSLEKNETAMYQVTAKGTDGKMNMFEMLINDFGKKNLAAPYGLTYYDFICASAGTDVIEIKKSGKRYALYTHVRDFSISPNNKYLYLHNTVLQKDGSWKDMHRIITIATKQSRVIPNALCNQLQSFWSDNRLLTTGTSFESQTGDQQICVWDTNGILQGRARSSLRENNGYIGSLIGVLPKQPNVMYTLNVDNDTSMCNLYLQDLKKSMNEKTIATFKEDTTHTCAIGYAQIDVSKLQMESGSFRYRTAPDYQGQWSSWQTVK